MRLQWLERQRRAAVLARPPAAAAKTSSRPLASGTYLQAPIFSVEKILPLSTN
jgi:hypothetical protein